MQSEQGKLMTTYRKLAVRTAALAVLLALGACSGMTQREQNTAIGAGAGALVGGVLTGGSTLGVVGGAAVGGVIGHEVGPDDRNHRR
jgi:osmotically inducible lipoprotein OsmB